MEKGEFEKRFQEIANHIPLGLLDTLHLRERHAVYIPQSFLNVVDEAHKGFVTLDTARRIGKRITSLKGKELIQWAEAYANSKNEKWFKEWFSEE